MFGFLHSWILAPIGIWISREKTKTYCQTWDFLQLWILTKLQADKRPPPGIWRGGPRCPVNESFLFAMHEISSKKDILPRINVYCEGFVKGWTAFWHWVVDADCRTDRSSLNLTESPGDATFAYWLSLRHDKSLDMTCRHEIYPEAPLARSAHWNDVLHLKIVEG